VTYKAVHIAPDSIDNLRVRAIYDKASALERKAVTIEAVNTMDKDDLEELEQYANAICIKLVALRTAFMLDPGL